MASAQNLTPQAIEFLSFEIRGVDPARQKKALQLLASSLRGGGSVRPDGKTRLEIDVVRLLHSSKDDKVVRWCLNCLALLGTRQDSESAVLAALKANQDRTDIVAAGIAALSAISPVAAFENSIVTNIAPEVRVLASLQIHEPGKLDIGRVVIDLDVADKEVLKLALIVVGLDKALPNIFHPKHPNGVFVKELGLHDDSIVVQYSVWAAISNPNLDMRNVGVDPANLENLSANIQSKYLQLVALKEKDVHLRHDLIGRGHALQSSLAREGLARGIMHDYYDGLEEITVDWYDGEPSDVVRRRLAEHFSRHSMSSPVYSNKAQEIFQENPEFRPDILFGAEKTKLFPILKARDIQESTKDMFGGELGSDIIGRISQTSPAKKLPRKTVLMFFAAPIDQSALDLDAEKMEVEAALKGINKPVCEIDIVSVDRAKSEDIHSKILMSSPDVLHFSGHGNKDGLAFENPNSRTSMAVGTNLLKLCSLYKDSIKCVVLNSCYSKMIFEKLPHEIPIMIGCSEGVGDYAAQRFSVNFYSALKGGREYVTAFRAAIEQMKLQGLKDEARKYSIMKGN